MIELAVFFSSLSFLISSFTWILVMDMHPDYSIGKEESGKK